MRTAAASPEVSEVAQDSRLHGRMQQRLSGQQKLISLKGTGGTAQAIPQLRVQLDVEPSHSTVTFQVRPILCCKKPLTSLPVVFRGSRR